MDNKNVFYNFTTCTGFDPNCELGGVLTQWTKRTNIFYNFLAAFCITFESLAIEKKNKLFCSADKQFYKMFTTKKVYTPIFEPLLHSKITIFQYSETVNSSRCSHVWMVEVAIRNSSCLIRLNATY